MKASLMKASLCVAIAAMMAFLAATADAADVTESQWVRLSDQGTVAGRVVVPRGDEISAVRSARVVLIDQNGKLSGSVTESDNTGRFVLENVSPGVYTLMVEGEDTFACCAMHVVNSNVPINSKFEIAAAALTPKVVRQAALRYLPAESRTEVSFDPQGNPLASERALVGEVVRVVQHNGGLKGRLTKAGFGDTLGLANANVLIFRDGVEVSRTTADEDGNFSVANLGAGSYSVLASSPEGFGVMGVELVDPLTVQNASTKQSSSSELVAQVGGVNDTFVMQAAPLPSAGSVISDEVISEEVVGPAVPLETTPGMVVDGGFGYAPGGGGFGGGGGGGGIGGGGSLRGMALIGGTAAALAIGLSDDDDTVVPPPPASPATP
jgi:hypothetical protein